MKTSNPLKRNKYSKNRPAFYTSMIPGDGFKDIVSGVSAVCSISGTRYGIVNGVVTQFAVNQPPIEDNGLRGCPAFTQYFLNNEAPVTQSITLAAGTYCLWIDGSGSAIFNGLTATAGVPKVFTLASGFTGNCVITGTVTKAMLNSGLFPAPFSPTEGVTKSFVSEAATSTTGTSFDLDNALLARLKTALRGPNAQGHLELTFKSNIDSGWATLYPALVTTIFCAGDLATRGLNIYRYTASTVVVRCVGAGASSPAEVIQAITPAQILKIVIDWGTHSTGQKMRITVNGVKSSLVSFSGSFGDKDLRFFFGNTVHAGWIVKDSLKVMDRPIW